MTQRGRKLDGKHAVQVGTNRGGRAFVENLPPSAGAGLARWSFFDTKKGRAADLAHLVHTRFPNVQTESEHADGRDGLRKIADDAVIVGTVDTIASTRALIEERRSEQPIVFQNVGRGLGPAIAASRLGFSGVVRNASEKAAASLLLDGFDAISAAASSRALTAAGDPMSAAILQPMRLATTRQTIRYFADLIGGRESADAPLTFFTSAGRFPLTVLADDSDAFSQQKARAVAAIDAVPLRGVGVVAAVALVSIEARAIDVLFVSRNREDHRRVLGVAEFRAPSQRYTAPAVFTD